MITEGLKRVYRDLNDREHGSEGAARIATLIIWINTLDEVAGMFRKSIGRNDVDFDVLHKTIQTTDWLRLVDMTTSLPPEVNRRNK